MPSLDADVTVCFNGNELAFGVSAVTADVTGNGLVDNAKANMDEIKTDGSDQSNDARSAALGLERTDGGIVDVTEFRLPDEPVIANRA